MAVDWAAFGVDLHLEVGTGRGTGAGRRVALERALRDGIRSGRLAPQAKLPSTRSLAAELGLARGTVNAAYDQLIAEGYLQARTGSGTIVADLRAAPPATAPHAVDDDAPTLRPPARDSGCDELPGLRVGAVTATGVGHRTAIYLRVRRSTRSRRTAPGVG